MHGKIVLLYETETGRVLCEMASRVLAEIAVAFRHTLSLPVRRCPGAALDDDTLNLADGALAILCGESSLRALGELALEMGCKCRTRELRYTHLIEDHALMGEPLKALIVQALESDESVLKAAAEQAFKLSNKENVPILQVPPSGKLNEMWQKAVTAADEKSIVFHARSIALTDVIPDMVHDPKRFGVVLCPPFGGGIVSAAAAALCGAEGMCYDYYTGGECPICAPLHQQDGARNPIGMLRAVEDLLQKMGLGREAACVEAAIRNVLQAGWRTQDVAHEDLPRLDAESVAELVCQQIEVAGEWILNT